MFCRSINLSWQCSHFDTRRMPRRRTGWSSLPHWPPGRAACRRTDLARDTCHTMVTSQYLTIFVLALCRVNARLKLCLPHLWPPPPWPGSVWSRCWASGTAGGRSASSPAQGWPRWSRWHWWGSPWECPGAVPRTRRRWRPGTPPRSRWGHRT